MRRLVLISLLLCVFLPVFSQQELSDDAQISVVTFGPWKGELWSAFGHSAFRVYDPINDMDYAYNYGVFSFESGFYLNFARGHNYYKLGIMDYQDFKNYYIYYNRYVHEQVLNLTSDQKQKLFDYLQWNALPDNEKYRYDYFYNNCATKIRDVVVEVLGDSVRFDGSYITTSYSIRDLTDIYLAQQPWGDLGIDICLGLPMDKIASPYEYMFLPDYIESGFDHAFIKRDGKEIPIVKNKINVYAVRAEDPMDRLPHPLYWFSVLALISLFLAWKDFKQKKLSNWFDAILFGVTGFIGLVLFLLWTATDHAAAAKNYNLLWALPTHLVVAFLLFKNRSWLEKYFLGTLVILVLTLLAWKILPQALNTSLIPIIIALGIRSFAQIKIRKLNQPPTYE
jgi:hypothetical protein